jgi:hypothetical protein
MHSPSGSGDQTGPLPEPVQSSIPVGKNPRRLCGPFRLSWSAVCGRVPRNVQNIVQIHVRQHRRDHSPLRCPQIRVQHPSIFFQYPRLQPLPDQSQQRPISYPLPQQLQQLPAVLRISLMTGSLISRIRQNRVCLAGVQCPSVLRTVLSFPVALHTASPRCRYYPLVPGSTPTEGLPPSNARSFSSAPVSDALVADIGKRVQRGR